MAKATLRFYEELNDYLPPQQRKRGISAEFKGSCPARHLIETQGVPHTEVEIILINGVSVDLEAHVRDGDLVSVYPMFEALDVSPLLRLRSQPLRKISFFADAQLCRLARHLRLLGFDTLCESSIGDADLVRRAAEDRRIILSRDRALLMRRRVTHACHIRQDDLMEQLIHVVRRCDLAEASRPFTRCMECNHQIEPVSKQAVAALLEPQTAASFDEFQHCPGCDRIYWKGSHYAHLKQRVASVLERAQQAAPDSAGDAR